MEKQLLPVKLTKKELQEATDRLVEEIQNRDEVEKERKAAAAEYKERISNHDEEISRCADMIRRKEEDRDVDVDEKRNNERGVIEFIRMDTREVIGTRDMTDEEKNLDMFKDEKGSDPAD